MIAFACLQCGMKFNVKDEFGGRSTTCPTCKQPLKVPEVSRTAASIPVASLAGSMSSVEAAGATVTVAHTDSRETPVGDLLNTGKASDDRYIFDREIARGGMG